MSWFTSVLNIAETAVTSVKETVLETQRNFESEKQRAEAEAEREQKSLQGTHAKLPWDVADDFDLAPLAETVQRALTSIFL